MLKTTCVDTTHGKSRAGLLKRANTKQHRQGAVRMLRSTEREDINPPDVRGCTTTAEPVQCPQQRVVAFRPRAIPGTLVLCCA